MKVLISIFKLFILLSIFCLTNIGFSQNLDIKAEMGENVFISSKGVGPFLKIALDYKIRKQHKVGFFISQIYMESSKNLPENLTEDNFFLRDYTHITPLGENNNPLKWDLNGFPKYRLKSKPNRYYKYSLGLSYDYSFLKNDKLSIGGEVLFSYCDEMEIAKVVNVNEIEFGFPPNLLINDVNIPIYSYATYLDIGFASKVEYMIYSYRKLDFGTNLHIFYYPFSSEVFSNFGFVIKYNN